MVRHPATGSTLALFLLLGSWAAAPARAQADESDSTAPAHIAVVDGVATLERQGLAEAAIANLPLIAGDRLRTERGRLEILFADGSALDLDHFTTIDLPSDTLLRLLSGRVRLTIEGSDPSEAVTYRIDTPGGSVDIRTIGEYRISLSGPTGAERVELAVVRGAADLTTEAGSVPVRAGQRSIARSGAPPSYPYVYNSAAWDAFDRWSDDRRAARLGVASAAYLPTGLHQYGGTFDRYGYWDRHPSHGYVWYPRVAVGWRPYHHGRWSYVGPFGWTWLGYDAWSWPTHHYGSWGFSAGTWFWIPGRRWGPAWVSWAWAPDYVAWCPLGFDGRPVLSFSAFYGSRPFGSRAHPWTVLPHRYFGHVGRAVSTYAVAAESLDAPARAQFVERRAIPRPAGLAVPRAAPVVAAGTRAGRAVPRSGVVAAPVAGRVDGRTSSGGTAQARSRALTAPSAAQPTAQPRLGALATRREAAPTSSDRTVRIIGRPRAPAASAAPVDQPESNPAAVRRARPVAPDAFLDPRAATSRAVPRSGGLLSGPARQPAAPRGTSPPGRATTDRPGSPPAPAGPAGVRAPDRRLEGPSRMPTRGSGLAAPSAPAATPRGRAPGRRTPAVRSGGVRAPNGPSRPPGVVRSPSTSQRPSTGVRPPSRPAGGVGAGAAAPRPSAPKASAPKGGSRPGAVRRPPKGGSREGER